MQTGIVLVEFFCQNLLNYVNIYFFNCFSVIICLFMWKISFFSFLRRRPFMFLYKSLIFSFVSAQHSPSHVRIMSEQSKRYNIFLKSFETFSKYPFLFWIQIKYLYLCSGCRRSLLPTVSFSLSLNCHALLGKILTSSSLSDIQNFSSLRLDVIQGSWIQPYLIHSLEEKS